MRKAMRLPCVVPDRCLITGALRVPRVCERTKGTQRYGINSFSLTRSLHNSASVVFIVSRGFSRTSDFYPRTAPISIAAELFMCLYTRIYVQREISSCRFDRCFAKHIAVRISNIQNLRGCRENRRKLSSFFTIQFSFHSYIHIYIYTSVVNICLRTISYTLSSKIE